MTAEQRKHKISELLKEHDAVKVTELSELFGISQVTVRAYLEDMEKKLPQIKDILRKIYTELNLDAEIK